MPHVHPAWEFGIIRRDTYAPVYGALVLGLLLRHRRESALVELDGQSQPDQHACQNLPGHRRDRKEAAPATDEKGNAEKHQAQKQGTPGYLFGTS